MKKFLIILLILLSGVIFAQEDSFFFEEDFEDQDKAESLFTFSHGGSTGISGKVSPDYKNLNGFLDVDFLASSSIIDISGNVEFKVQNLDDINDFPLQNSKFDSSFYIDTLFLRFYHSLFDLEIGLLKPIWGNADGIHAVDVLNPLDYSDPFGTSYLDSKISQQMVKLNIPVGGTSLIEIAYLPTFKGDYIPMEGEWTPYYIKNMEDTIYNMAYSVGLETAKETYPSYPESALIPGVEAEASAAATLIASNISFDESEYFTDSQGAIRFTTSVSSADLGFTYYYGFLKQPTIDPEDVLENSRINLIYNRVQTIGFDFAAQVGMFNLKGEAGLNLTEDSDGTDSSIYNNSVKYILGFDINIPISNINFLLQGSGTTILNTDDLSSLDPIYNQDEEYTTISLLGRISDSYLNDTLSVEIAGAYYLFDNDFMLKPKVTYSINDNTKVFCEYLLLEGDESTTFGQYSDNDRLEIGLIYSF